MQALRAITHQSIRSEAANVTETLKYEEAQKTDWFHYSEAQEFLAKQSRFNRFDVPANLSLIRPPSPNKTDRSFSVKCLINTRADCYSFVHFWDELDNSGAFILGQKKAKKKKIDGTQSLIQTVWRTKKNISPVWRLKDGFQKVHLRPKSSYLGEWINTVWSRIHENMNFLSHI